MPHSAPARFVTIGVYGFKEAAFFAALQNAKVDTFCDIRWRRGVRGSEYAFANSGRLQRRLKELGIRYVHLRELAPTPAIRERQALADKQAHISRRKRTTLSEDFIAAYRSERLAKFEPEKFLENLGPEAGTVALFCVEREPEACHRWLVAERLKQDVGAEIVHVTPDNA
jgi:uncharacterized protein (DUF488 family)